MRRAALLFSAAAVALLVSGAAVSASPRACADGGDAPAWSPTGRWVAWDPEGTNGICFSRANGTQRRLLRLQEPDEPPYELVWAKPNLLVADSNYTVYSVAVRPTPHVNPPGHAFSGAAGKAGDTFSLDAKADLLATANSVVAGPVTIMRPNGETTSIGDSSAVNAYPSLAPDGKHVVWSAPGGILSASIDGTHSETLNGRGEEPLWSPSGRKIAFEYQGLHVMTASGGHKATVAHDCCSSGWPETVAWSPDSRMIAFANDPGRLAVVDVRTKRRHTVKHIGFVEQLAWAPNSAELLVTTASRACASRWRVPVRNGKPKLVSRCTS